MKQCMICNLPPKPNKRYRKENVLPLINCQIHNSKNLGWQEKDILLLTNFEYEFMGVKAIKTELNKSCFTGSKLYAAQYVFKNNLCDELLHCHDLDCWYNIYFSEPKMREVGISPYSNVKKLNGGSVFYRSSAINIIDDVIKSIEQNEDQKEEPTINKLFRLPKYKNRITVLNSTYCIGCSGYFPRYMRALKPPHIVHFNPRNRLAVETHMLNRDGMEAISVSKRLEHILRKYFPNLATELSPEGKKRSVELRKKHLNKVY